MRNVSRLCLVLATVIATSGCWANVHQGHVGLLVDNFSGEISQVLDPGLRASVPFGQHIVEYPIIVQQYVMVKGGERDDTGRDDAVRVNSQEGQTFQVDASVEFRIKSKAEVPRLYQRYGMKFDEIVGNYYRSKFKAALAHAFSSLPLNEAITGLGRRRVERMATETLRQTLGDDHVEILQVLIRAVYVPDAIANAIADKTRAENELVQSRTHAQQAVVEAEAAAKVTILQAESEARGRLIRAKAEAQANREIAGSLTPRLLQKLYVEKLSDKIQLVLPANGFFNFGGVIAPLGSPEPAKAK